MEELNTLSLSEDLWSDTDKARNIMRKKSEVQLELTKFNKAESDFDTYKSMLELAEDENDSSTTEEMELELIELEKSLKVYQLECFFCGEADQNSCYLEVHAGAGGTEAQDWAQMLLRMYSRWAENHKYNLDILEILAGEEAGIKSATLKITGSKAYGWLKGESGIHRLVRISPFDSNARRHTSFASIGVYPEVDETIHVDIQEKDLRIDYYRASGAGGQHVNKTDSAVRITHIPTGIVVQCQTDRSQHRNRAIAYDMLKSRLYELELRRREDNKNQQEKNEIGWGYQIRSYVMQPYQMVKDLRTGFEKGNVAAVLDGEIDEFLQSNISAKIGNNSQDKT